MTYEKRWETVDVKVEDGIAWVTLNRPEKKNAMSPTLNREMIDVLETLELDQNAKVLVLTGAGDSWTAGMDLKEYFREVDTQPEIFQERIRRDSCRWQWQLQNVLKTNDCDGEWLVFWWRFLTISGV
jgi:trans-feruloyl-CoA hydratase/vanillin synthase